ncbi:MAG: hypothetical protein LUE27_06475 [Clostridia bacterium]|nr:hypothetical protein [Clostridia bacterium]
MIDEDMLQEALFYAMKSEYHREAYENAHSAACKRYLALSHYYSHYWVQIRNNEEKSKEYFEEEDRIEQELQLKDWEHLRKYAPHNPIRLKYKKKIEELKAKEQEPGTETE